MFNFYHPTRRAYLQDLPRNGRGALWTREVRLAFAFTADCREELVAEFPELAKCEVRTEVQ